MKKNYLVINYLQSAFKQDGTFGTALYDGSTLSAAAFSTKKAATERATAQARGNPTQFAVIYEASQVLRVKPTPIEVESVEARE